MLRDISEVVITSTVVDALTFWAHGVPHVVGGSQIDAALLQQLENSGVSRATLAFPRTPEGEALAQELLPLCEQMGLEVFQIMLPNAHTVNQLAIRSDDPADRLQELVRQAAWIRGVSSSTSTRSPAEVVPQENQDLPGTPSGEIVVQRGDRRWRVRGLDKKHGPESLRINLMVSRNEYLHVDNLDLYSARHRGAFIKEASSELCVEEQTLKSDLGKLLLSLEEQQDKLRQQEVLDDAPPEMTPTDRAAAMALLRDPHLIDRLREDLDEVLVGEGTNKLLVYLAATSRLLVEPLAVLVQSSSSAGKTTLVDTVLELMPSEARVSFSAVTAQSLFYMEPDQLKHRILSLAEQEGASRASYSLKLLQSEGSVTIASTGRDPGTGRMRTESYRVEGPMALMMTTTGLDVDPELANRCLVLTVDESREQTRAIHDRQRRAETLSGIETTSARAALQARHRNAQRLLDSLRVINPWASRLSYPDHQTRCRRDHGKYLTLIRTVALLHQHQRPILQGSQGVRFIEVTAADIALANQLASEVLGRSLDDLPPQTRRLLEVTHELATSERLRLEVDQPELRFTRRQLADHAGLGMTQLRLHLERLVDHEYLIRHGNGRGQLASYELLWKGEGSDGQSFVLGLSEVTQAPIDPTSRPHGAPLAGPNRPHGGDPEEDRSLENLLDDEPEQTEQADDGAEANQDEPSYPRPDGS